MTNGVDMVKDGLPPIAVATGVIVNQSSPYTTLQIIGAVIGAIGAFAALWRCWEYRRAINLEQLRWEHENGSNKISETTTGSKTEKQQTPSNGKSKKKNTR